VSWRLLVTLPCCQLFLVRFLTTALPSRKTPELPSYSISFSQR
jgi:hypothetical protein